MRPKVLLCLVLLLALLASIPPRTRASEAGGTTSDEDLVRKEQVRAQVDAIFTDLRTAPEREPNQSSLFTWITERLLALGPSVVPLMVSELEDRSKVTFNIAAYVLGMQRAPETKEAVLKAARVAERDGGAFGTDRRVWLSYALALTGDPDAIDLLDSGKDIVMRKEFVENMSTIEVVSILTGPRGTPKLLERLERYGHSDDPELRSHLHLLLRALARVPDPSLRDKILPYLKHDLPYVRDAAARALVAPGDPAVADRLFAALDDPLEFSRFGVAASIEQLKPTGKARAIQARLDSETNTAVRGCLYRTLASTEGEAAIETLARHFGREDPVDRVFLVDAVAQTHSRKGLNLLRTALKDQDNRVVIHALAALADIAAPPARDALVAMVDDPRWPVEEQDVRLLARVKELRAAPRIADRFRPMLVHPIADPAERDQVTIRGDALADLGYVAILPDVRKATELASQDPTVVEYLRDLAWRLAALEERKDDPRKWIDALSASEPPLRRLAYRRLLELKPPAAVKPLMDTFGKVDVEEGVEILRILGTIASAESIPLLERVLLDPSFDEQERAPLRSMAAWAASRTGMKTADTLKRAAERREGRDVDVLVALAILTGKDAVPTLEALRVPRLRWFDWKRGTELERLDWIVRELKAGRSIARLDRPPDEIALD